MALNIGKEIAALKRMTATELRDKHLAVFGEETRSGNKAWLIKRIAWRIQAESEGDLTDRARERAAVLANDSDLRTKAPRKIANSPNSKLTKTVAVKIDHDPRLPMPGAIITREYKGKTITVKVLPHGFEHEGEVYRTLSAVAKAVTGAHWNGYHFFRLGKSWRRQ